MQKRLSNSRSSWVTLVMALLGSGLIVFGLADQTHAATRWISSGFLQDQETEETDEERQEAKQQEQESDSDSEQEESRDAAEQDTEPSDASEDEGPETPPATEKTDSTDTWIDSLQWREVGPTATGGRVVDIAVDPNDDHHIFVASAAGGLWETRNNGTTWNCTFENEAVISIGDIAIDPNDSNTLWIGSGEANNQRSSLAGNGVYKSVDGGKTWQHLGLEETHHIGRIIIDPSDSNTVFVAAVGHLYTFNQERGLYKTTDGGQTWNKVLYVNPRTGVIDVAMHPDNPKVLLAAAYERIRKAWNFDGNGPGSGIYRSEDGGESWNRIESNLPGGDIGRIGVAFFPGDANIAYATVANQNPAEPRSSDDESESNGDDSEQESAEASDDPQADDSEAEQSTESIETGFGFELVWKDPQWVVGDIDRSAARRLEGLRKDDVLVSLAGIANWSPERIKGFLESLKVGDQVAWSFQRKGRDEPLTLSLGLPAEREAREVGGQVYRSDDSGKTWTLVSERPVGGQPPYYYGQIRVDPEDADRVYMLGVPMFVSTDGGKTFESNGAPSVHVDHHALWINPDNPRHIMLGNDGGFHISYDQAETWDYVFNIPLAQFYAITVDQQIPYHVYGGLQDNGSWGGPSEAAGGVTREAWYRVGGGDGFYVQVDPNDHNLIFSESQFGALGRQNRETGERGFIRPPQTDADNPDRVADRYNWNSPILMSQHDPRTIYFGGNKLFLSYNRGDDWLTISPDLTTNDPAKTTGNVPHCTITTIAESPRDPEFLVVGTDDGKVHVTRDRGKHWQDISTGFPLQPTRWWCSRVECSRSDLETIYVSFTGYREDDFRAFVFKSEDAGQTWKSIVSNLPSENVNVIKQDPRTPTTLYVGTEHGVYVSLDDGGQWHELKGIPRVSVQDLLVHPRDRDLVIGTHGRGIYILDEITPLQERGSWMAERKEEQKTHLYSVNDLLLVRPSSVDSFAGDRKRSAPSPDPGVAIWYEVLDGAELKDSKMVVKKATGETVATIELEDKPGLHQARYPSSGRRSRFGGRRRGGGGGGMEPGRYTVQWTVGETTHSQSFEIRRP